MIQIVHGLEPTRRQVISFRHQFWSKCLTPHGDIGPHRVNTLRPRQNGCHFADDTFKRIFLNENVIISTKISLKSVPKGPINNIPALVQIMAWRRPGDKPLSEAMMVRLLTHICVARPQWIGHNQNQYCPIFNGLSPVRRQAITWTTVDFFCQFDHYNGIWIDIQNFSFMKMHLKMSSAKWRSFCLGGLTCLTLYMHVRIAGSVRPRDDPCWWVIRLAIDV